MTGIIVRIGCLIVAIFMIAVVLSGIRDAFLQGSLLHLMAKRSAILIVWFSVCVIVLFEKFLPSRWIRATIWLIMLCLLVFMRYQMLPYSYIREDAYVSGLTRSRIDQLVDLNGIGGSVEMGEKDGGSYRWYATTGNLDLIPAVFSIFPPLLVLGILYWVRVRETGIGRTRSLKSTT